MKKKRRHDEAIAKLEVALAAVDAAIETDALFCGRDFHKHVGWVRLDALGMAVGARHLLQSAVSEMENNAEATAAERREALRRLRVAKRRSR
jgi:hypothetical protein